MGRMTLIRMLVFGVFFCIIFSGCEKQNQFQSDYTLPVKHIVSIRYRDARNAEALPKTHFFAGEVPAVRIAGCGGYDVWFLLVEEATGKVIKGVEQHIGEGKSLCWPFPDLFDGSYYVVLKVPGKIRKEICTFTVSQ